MVRTPFGVFGAIVALTLAVGCGSDGSTGPSTGTLTVTITTPAGVTGNVTVSGPNGYSKALTASQSLAGLPSGTYTVAGANVVVAHSIVGSDTNVATVTGSPATVSRNGTATVTVAYALSDSVSGGLWVMNARSSSTNEFVQYSAAQLAASGSPAPVAGILGASFTEAGSVAFDRQGNLWSVGSNRVITEYTAAQLDSTNPTAVLTLTVSGSSDLSSIAFDSTGNLWMVDPGPCNFYAFNAATLANHSGVVALAPDISILPGCGGPGENPWAIAFDKNWNLWVSDNGNEVVYEFPKDSLKQGFSGLFASRLISGLNNTEYLAFDATGNLWVTTGENDSTFQFSASQLADTTTAPTPAISIGINGASNEQLQGLAFDNSGNLWTVDAENNQLYELAASQLTANGAVTPSVAITANNGSLVTPWGLAFAPHSSGLPLFLHAPPKLTTVRGRVRR
jgi:glucose/arabinose dehydrogenase